MVRVSRLIRLGTSLRMCVSRHFSGYFCRLRYRERAGRARSSRTAGPATNANLRSRWSFDRVIPSARGRRCLGMREPRCARPSTMATSARRRRSALTPGEPPGATLRVCGYVSAEHEPTAVHVKSGELTLAAPPQTRRHGEPHTSRSRPLRAQAFTARAFTARRGEPQRRLRRRHRRRRPSTKRQLVSELPSRRG